MVRAERGDLVRWEEQIRGFDDPKSVFGVQT
jgi:hypothetical protein